MSFEKKPVPEVEVKASMDHAMEFCRPTRPYPHMMGAPALGRLWKEAEKNPGLQGLKRKERYVGFCFLCCFWYFFSRLFPFKSLYLPLFYIRFFPDD